MTRGQMSFVGGVLVGLTAITVVAFAAFADRQESTIAAEPRATAQEAGSLRVFSRPVVSQSTPAGVVAALRELHETSGSVEPALRPGAVLMQDARLLATDGATRLYAAPTVKGGLCFSITGGPSGCEDRVGRGAISWGMYDADVFGRGAPIAVYGFVPDDATKVDLTIRGEVLPARLGANAFLARAPDTRSVPESIVVTYTDGETESIDMGPPPPGS